eukprot:gene10621-4059_t
MDFAAVLFVDPMVLFAHSPEPLFAHHAPAAAPPAARFASSAPAYVTHAEEAVEWSSGRAPYAGRWRWNASRPGVGWEQARELAAALGPPHAGVLLLRPGGNVVAALLAVVTRHAAHLCSAAAVVAAALQPGAAEAGWQQQRQQQHGEQQEQQQEQQREEQREEEQEQQQLAALRRHALSLRLPPLRRLHRAVVLVGPFDGLSPAALRTGGGPAAPMVLHRCCGDRAAPLAAAATARWHPRNP